jgi:hypothetical protein
MTAKNAKSLRSVIMEKTIQELKNLLRELILEVGDLKERITVLEKETHPKLQPEKGLERPD